MPGERGLPGEKVSVRTSSLPEIWGHSEQMSFSKLVTCVTQGGRGDRGVAGIRGERVSDITWRVCYNWHCSLAYFMIIIRARLVKQVSREKMWVSFFLLVAHTCWMNECYLLCDGGELTSLPNEQHFSKMWTFLQEVEVCCETKHQTNWFTYCVFKTTTLLTLP